MTNRLIAFLLASLNMLGMALPCDAADPWADNVVSYRAGEAFDFGLNPPAKVPLTDFIMPAAALGEPARRTSNDDPIDVTVGADGMDDVVSIGEGGHLTVSFDEPVADDPNNPFGIDLLIFGNAFLFDFDLDTGAMDGRFDGVFSEAGILEVSSNGQDYVEVTNVVPDGIFPTRGYLDDAGTLPTDFTRPVDPNFDPLGHTLAEIQQGYGISGGGFGVDLADVGLPSITHVRISNPLVTEPGQTFSITPEIDAIVDVATVPEPTSLALASASIAWFFRRRVPVGHRQPRIDG